MPRFDKIVQDRRTPRPYSFFRSGLQPSAGCRGPLCRGRRLAIWRCVGPDRRSVARGEFREVKTIICTAYGDFRRDFGTWASDAYITKSADLTELKRKIRELLSEA